MTTWYQNAELFEEQNLKILFLVGFLFEGWFFGTILTGFEGIWLHRGGLFVEFYFIALLGGMRGKRPFSADPSTLAR